MPNPIVFNASTGKIKTVKNLGWLLKHWYHVTGFTTYQSAQWDFQGTTLVAHLGPGRKFKQVNDFSKGSYYQVFFADHSVLTKWLKRPVFYGLKCDGKEITK